MRLLITTQALDLDDPVLSAYHAWVEELAARVEHVEVICLKEGRHALPKNVTVHTLGKESMHRIGKHTRITYASRFLSLAWTLRSRYDAVFVHMNEEYLLIAGWLWRLLGKRVYMWRNHFAGTWKTDLAAFWCHRVFCTSKHSYTASYKKTTLMPAGIDTEIFENVGGTRTPRSILFFSRIASSKRPEIFLDALGILHAKGIGFTASIVGSPLPENEPYHRMLQAKAAALGIGRVVTFAPGVPHVEAPQIFRAHEVFVNCSPSGMLDKMLFEAAAAGCMVFATSEDFKEMAGEEFWFKDAHTLADRLAGFLAIGATPEMKETLTRVAEEHSFTHLMTKLADAILTP